jgi:hypothetical protein
MDSDYSDDLQNHGGDPSERMNMFNVAELDAQGGSNRVLVLNRWRECLAQSLHDLSIQYDMNPTLLAGRVIQTQRSLLQEFATVVPSISRQDQDADARLTHLLAGLMDAKLLTA